MIERRNNSIVVISIWVSMIIQTLSIAAFAIGKYDEFSNRLTKLETQMQLLLEAHKVITK
jgi:hypothetical protein